MDEVTQQNAALVEQAAAAAQSLQEQASHLKGAVSVFKLADSGRAPAPARVALPKRPVVAQVRKAPVALRKPKAAPQLSAPSVVAEAAQTSGAADSWETF
jgi:hypothetical protein